jgi:hypothetical protein
VGAKDRLATLTSRYLRWEERRTRRIRHWSMKKRWLAFVFVPVVVLCCGGVVVGAPAWRVEVVKRGHTHWYRIVHGDSEIDWLSIAAVERILGEAGIGIADLVQVTAKWSGSSDHPMPGVAET